MTDTIPVPLRPDRPAGDASLTPLSPRSISMEDIIKNQVDRIGYLRSAGEPWDEAVQNLRDLVIGLEDDQFDDGIPDHVRKNLSTLTPAEQRAERERWAPHGWNGVPIRAYRRPDGTIRWAPTAQDLSNQYRIIMALLDRRGISWRRKRVSYLAAPNTPPGESDEDT